MIKYSEWCALTLPVRMQLAQQFGIAKTGSTHVANNQVVSDGYKVEEIENALSIEAMQMFTGSSSKDPSELFAGCVAKLTAPLDVVEPMNELVPATTGGSLEESNAKPEKVKEIKIPAKRGRKPKA